MPSKYEQDSMNMKTSKDNTGKPADMSTETDTSEGEGHENLAYLPEGVFKKAQPGKKVSGSFEGEIVEKDGKLYINVKSINGQSTEMPSSVDSTESDDTSMNAGESLDKYMNEQRANAMTQ